MWVTCAHTHRHLRVPFKREPAARSVNSRLHQLHLPQRPAAVLSLPELLHSLPELFQRLSTARVLELSCTQHRTWLGLLVDLARAVTAV